MHLNFRTPLFLLEFLLVRTICCDAFTFLKSEVSTRVSSSSSKQSTQLFSKGFGKPPKGDEGKKIPLRGAEAAAALPAERRANLFQSLLRDLQIEGVPLLECDAASVETYQAACWTTLAEMSDDDEPSKNCLVMEKIPMSALMSFADDFATLKLQPRLMEYLPELNRFSIQVLGKGVGPALVFEASARTDDEKAEKDQRMGIESKTSEENATAALKSFVRRMVIAESACPYTKNEDIAPVGLEAKGVNPSNIGYRYGGSSDAAHAMAMFWTCICELQSFPQSEISTIVLSLPCIGAGMSNDSHTRFASVVELISRSLCMFRGDAMFGLVHFHPSYDRDAIFPSDKPAYGHLPPRDWLRPMLRLSGNDEAANNLTAEQLALSDYQRRSPHTAINILRTTQIAAAAGAKSIVDLQLDDSTTVKASGITTYSRNAIRLAEIGKPELDAAVHREVEMTWSK